VQGPIVWLKGEPVTMVGRGRFLAVFYHECNPLVDGTQKLGYTLYDGATMRQISSGSVSGISVASSLTWAGFSNDLALSIMDDDGMVSLLMATKPDETGDDSSFSWVPMLDTIGLRKSREDSFWPVSIQNGKLICVPLKGVSYPNPTRRPLTTALQLRIPLARDGKDKT
jgi:chromosome transmission fidelity protein 4